MNKLLNNDISEYEKKSYREKYIHLVNENKEFIEIIKELRKENTNYIMINKPIITKENKSFGFEEIKDDNREKLLETNKK